MHETQSDDADTLLWRSGPPKLCVIIDTEEEFDWTAPFDRGARSVTSMKAQGRAQEIFDRYGIVPTYVIDHPVVSDLEAVAMLRQWQDKGDALIGTHLHPWVSPPYEEDVSRYNSYPGNLPAALEFRKLERLTNDIEAAFGRRPLAYKAGRYGLGKSTPAALEKLGYKVDLSIVPYTSFAADGGPDYTDYSPFPMALAGAEDVLAIPLSVGFSGELRHWGKRLYPVLLKGISLRLPGVFARARLLERIRLSPEGQGYADHIRLTKALLADGLTLFSYTYHSPSLVPGHTPYVQDKGDLARFLDNMDRYFDYFFNVLSGHAVTPHDIYNSWAHGRNIGKT